MYGLRKIWSPELFQGAYKSKNYFEGWYYKIISADYKHIYAVIPGIALGPNSADAQAFIQVINGQTGRVDFFKYSFSAFSYDKRRFAITIAGSNFSREAIRLNLANPDLHISGDLRFYDIIPFPKTFLNPKGIVFSGQSVNCGMELSNGAAQLIDQNGG